MSSRKTCLILCAALLSTPLAGSLAAQDGPSEDAGADSAVEARARRLALVLATSAEQETRARMHLLVRLGPSHAPAMLSVLERGGVPGPDRQARRLERSQEMDLLDALALLDGPELQPMWAEVARSGEPSRRATALRVLASSPGPSDLDLLARLAIPPTTEGPPGRSLRDAFSAALSARLTRTPELLAVLDRSFRQLQPCLWEPAVRALGRAPSLESLALLVSLLDEGPALRVPVLLEIARAASHLEPPFPAAVFDPVRAELNADSALEYQAAARALVALEDLEAAPLLIEGLSDGLGPVRLASRDALQALAEQPLGDDEDAWRAWHQEQESWRAQRMPSLLANLRPRVEPATAASALLELAHGRLFRHEIAPHVAAILRRPETDVVVLACAVLERLGSSLAVAPLTDALRDPRPEVRTAVQVALERLDPRNHSLSAHSSSLPHSPGER